MSTAAPDPMAIADLLIARRDSQSPLPVADVPGPLDHATAYQVQAAVAARRSERNGWRVAGYKIGATNPAARAMLKIDQCFFGRLFDATNHDSPATLPAAPGFWHVYEPEIAIELSRDLPATGAPFTPDDLRAATRAIMPVIEVVGTGYTPWTETGVPLLIADNAIHGHLVMGRPVHDFAGLDLMELAVTLRINGVVAGTGRGGNVDGGPFGVAAWLANALAAQGYALRAGDRITTGTTMPPPPIGSNQDVLADFGPLGQVSLRIGG